MSKIDYVFWLVNEWQSIYKTLDKRTAKAREVKEYIRSLSNLLGWGC